MGVRLAKPSGRNEKETRRETSGGIGDTGTTENTNPTSPTEGIRIIGGDTSTSSTGEKEKLPRLPAVEVDPGSIPVPKPKKPRKPRKTTPSKKQDGEMTADMLASLLGVVFNLVALRAGDHWKLTHSEALAISEPLTRILARHDLVGKAGEYGDYIALTVALGGIVAPKIMMEMSKPKPKKKEVLTHVEPVREARRTEKPAAPNRETRANEVSNGSSDGTATQASPVSDSREHLGQLISAF